MSSKGWIALDIDGTITLDKHVIPARVTEYLRQLNTNGWKIAFATGRSFTFASIPLKALEFPFYFLPQNGSVTLKMPEKTIVTRNYLSSLDLQRIIQLCRGMQIDPLVYAGVENEDRCFFCSKNFSPSDQEYFLELLKREGGNAFELPSLDQFLIREFPMIKFFGLPAKISLIAQRLETHFQLSQIKDPFIPDIDLLLVTNHNTSKGNSLQHLIDRLGKGQRVIAAGDDRNDLSMFKIADFAIAMPHAPIEVREQADIIAGPTSEFGIIDALAKAISL